MWLCLKKNTPLAIFFLCTTLLAVNRKAINADEFVESMGVCTHFGYPDTPYGSRYEQVRDSLLSLGIRHTRDGLYKSEDLGKKGIKLCAGADVPSNTNGTLSTIQNFLTGIKNAQSSGALIDAIEGPNEPDIFWSSTGFKKSYNGVGYQQDDSGVIVGSINFQKDLYQLVKADWALKNFTVIGPAIALKRYPDSSLTNYVDLGNFHPYPGGGNSWSFPESYGTIQKYFWQSNQPSVNLSPWNYAFDQFGKAFAKKPMAATETGYNTHTAGISLKVHGYYIPRLFAEYFINGIKRTYIYELIDEWNLPDYGEANFGLLKNDCTPKPAFRALQSIIKLLSDRGDSFIPDSLDIFLLVKAPNAVYTRTENVHSLLLQKRTGVFYLLIWHEISNNDISVSPPREITVPPMPTTISFSHNTFSSIILHTLDDEGTMSSRQLPTTAGNSVEVGVLDRISVLELTPQAKSATSVLDRCRIDPLTLATKKPALFDIKGRPLHTLELGNHNGVYISSISGKQWAKSTRIGMR